MIGRNDDCWCGSKKKWKKCHFPDLGSQHFDPKEYKKKYGILLKTPEEIAGIRAAGHLAAKILDQLVDAALPGVTTNQLNDLANRLHKEAGATAAPLHYGTPPYPKSICTSLNNVICHGIPDDTPLKEGDILNIDVTAILNGFYGDCSRMAVIGKTTKERAHVVAVARECLRRGVAVCGPGKPLSLIGEAIESYAESMGCSTVHQFIGHGVGIFFHEDPQVMHTRNRSKVILAPGMTFTIEPMINNGKAEAVIDPFDEWTARTVDGKDSAQWEHTVLITEKGVEVLTPWQGWQ